MGEEGEGERAWVEGKGGEGRKGRWIKRVRGEGMTEEGRREKNLERR